jgi:hypothetical protein
MILNIYLPRNSFGIKWILWSDNGFWSANGQ